MANLTFKGGKFIIQDNEQKGLEFTYLDIFTKTPEGGEWLNKNNIAKETSGESPDFIFKTPDGKTIGLEITNLIIQTDKFRATATLNTIANQVCQHFKKEKGIALSLLVEIYDERKWSARWKDHEDYHYNPGFKHLEVDKKKIKDTFIAAISKGDISNQWVHKREWIDLPPHKFIITYDRMHEPHTSYHVNNTGMCKEDPFEELQETIDKKNKIYKSYKGKCDKCDLLIVSDGNNLGSYVIFSDKIKSHKFISSFNNTYLLDLGWGNTKTIKLKTKFLV